MNKYEFKVPSLFKGVTADEAVAELERIREKYGELQAETIVAESRDESAVLHRCFEWDDTIAAQKYREEQARSIVSNITVVVTNEEVTTKVRAYVHVCSSTDLSRSYVPLQEAIVSDIAYTDLLKQARADMRSFVEKYRQLEEVNPVKAEMLKVLSDEN